MTRWLGVCVLAAAAAAQQQPDPFAPMPADAFGPHTAPGAAARYAETMALLKAALARDPADVRALERTAELLGRFGRQLELVGAVRSALKAPLDEKPRGALRGLLGGILFQDARRWSWRGVNPAQLGAAPPPPIAKAVAAATEAVEHLREAIRTHPRSIAYRRDLAQALEWLDRETNGAEIVRLRNEADALDLKTHEEGPRPIDLGAEVERLTAEAARLEQRAEAPDHAGALLVRKRLLVTAFCTHTIPLVYEPAMYEPVSLLAPRNLVELHLTRSYRKRDGSTDHVAPQYFPPKEKQALEIIRSLGADTGPGSAAVLLAVLRMHGAATPLADAAFASLAKARHPAVLEHLPAMLAADLLVRDASASPVAQRNLVALAVALDLRAAAPVIARRLIDDTDILVPRGLADALGRLGSNESVDALLRLAADPGADIHFRRRAVLAFGRLAPDRLGELPREPALELAVAAARYRAAPSPELEGRILAAIGHGHETDEAAAYCAELNIRTAIPLLEQWRMDNKQHYAIELVDRAFNTLRGRS